MEKITIIGSGWLGLGLAKHLKENRYDVLASFRNQTTKFNLHERGINAIKLDLNTDELPDEIFYRDVLCILIPPSKNENYVQMLSKITQNPKLKHLRQIVFISSTSVYENTPEPKSEQSPIEQESIMAQSEHLFTKFPNTTILRMAGLMGENRYLSKYYKDVVENAQTLVNHIHKEDATGIIAKIIDENVHGIYNICAPLHPTRQAVIEEQCRVLNKKEPKFLDGTTKKATIITEKIDKKIFYMYKYPNPVHFLHSPL